MKTRSFTVTAIAVLLFNVVGFSWGDTPRARVLNPQASRLVSMLPASDAVAVIDTKRFLDEAMPRLLSANHVMLDHVMKTINDVEAKTGIDPRKFEQFVVGVSMKQNEAKGYKPDAVALAGGDINAGALLALAKVGSKGKYREEKVGETSVFVFDMKDAAKETATANKVGQATAGKIAKAIDKAKGVEAEVAISAIDRNTLAIGSLWRVRETIEAKSNVTADLVNLLLAKETAVMSFAAKTSGGMANMLPLDNDELGNTINSIQYLSGSLDVAAAGTSLQMMARTAKPDQALSLKETIDGLQMVGKAVLGNSKKPDHQIYSRMLKNAKFAVNGNDVTLDLLVPQADIDVLVAKVK